MRHSIEKKREEEKKLIQKMIKIYCKNTHKSQDLCSECSELAAYAMLKSDKCPRMEVKKFCSGCPHPCYGKDQRKSIQGVMRYSGPRLIFYAPIKTIEHAYETIKNQLRK